MKKNISVIILVSFCVPTLVFASWWNPATWFKKKNSSVQVQDVISPPSTKVSTVQPSVAVATATREQVDPAKVATTSISVEEKESKNLATCVVLTKELVKGQTDPEVTLLQKFLADNSYINARPNGTIGEGTYIAIKKLQFDNGLSQTGKIDSDTRKVINEINCGGNIANPVNTLDKIFKIQDKMVDKEIADICTTSTPKKASQILKSAVLDMDSKPVESMLEKYKNDPILTQKMKDIANIFLKNKKITKNCITKFDVLISKPENAMTFNNVSCSLVKNCMTNYLEAGKSFQSLLLLEVEEALK
jgi:hypothetical protein